MTSTVHDVSSVWDSDSQQYLSEGYLPGLQRPGTVTGNINAFLGSRACKLKLVHVLLKQCDPTALERAFECKLRKTIPLKRHHRQEKVPRRWVRVPAASCCDVTKTATTQHTVETPKCPHCSRSINSSYLQIVT